MKKHVFHLTKTRTLKGVFGQDVVQILVLFIMIVYVFTMFPKERTQFGNQNRNEYETMWKHHTLNTTAANTSLSCTEKSVLFDGECIPEKQMRKVRYDPCNPSGKRIVVSEWETYNRRPNTQSQTFGVLERHRFDCLVFPILFRSILERKMSEIDPVDYDSILEKRVSYRRAPYLNPIRVLVFGPHKELGKMRIAVESVHRAGKYPLDYIQADLSDTICKQYNAIKIDAMNIPFPDNFFDVLVFQHVLEHVADLNQTVRELERVLAPGGFAVLTSPVSMKLDKTEEDMHCKSEKCRQLKFKQFDHVRNIGSDILNILREKFDDVRSGYYWKFYETKMPYLQKLFSNPEYQHKTKEMFMYTFKDPDKEELRRIFD